MSRHVYSAGGVRLSRAPGNRIRPRGTAEHQVILAAGRFFAGVDGLPGGAAGEATWGETFLSVPGDMLHESYVDLFTGQEIRADWRQLWPTFFAHLSIAMLVPTT